MGSPSPQIKQDTLRPPPMFVHLENCRYTVKTTQTNYSIFALKRFKIFILILFEFYRNEILPTTADKVSNNQVQQKRLQETKNTYFTALFRTQVLTLEGASHNSKIQQVTDSKPFHCINSLKSRKIQINLKPKFFTTIYLNEINSLYFF